MNHSYGTIEGNFTNNTKVLTDLLSTCRQFNLSVLDLIQHEFKPQGFTAVVLLAESHFSIHTYPESCEAYTDLFCCNPLVDTEECIRYLCSLLDGTLLKVSTVRRDSALH
jgi:S-adenosylmethionine decarboxylase